MLNFPLPPILALRPLLWYNEQMNIDLHVHTRASACSSFDALRLAWSARVEGHPVVVTTNHHDERGDAEELFRECARFGILYFPAL